MIERLRSEWRARWRALVHRRRMDADLDEELAFHLEQSQRRLEAQGLPAAEARRRARAAFGAVEAVKDGVRDAAGLRALFEAWSDLGAACRGLRSHRAFTLGVVGTLALGIGANAAMFGIVDRLMFRDPPGLRAPERVRRVYVEWTENGEPRQARNMSYPRFVDFARDARTVERAGAFQVRTVALGQGDDTHEARAAIVTAGFLDLFDAPPVLGRWFGRDEDHAPDGAPVAVLGYAYWQARYGGRADVLGRTLRVDRLTATVIGVAPPGFEAISNRGAPAVFVPLTAFAHALRGPGYEASYNWSWLEVAVQLAPGVSNGAAEADLSAVLARSWQSEGAVHKRAVDLAADRPAVRLSPVPFGRGPDAGLDARVSLWIAGVALAVLLIACANVANLMLSRTVTRQRELAMRLALGIGRARLMRQLVVEGLLLGLLGAAGGLVLARLAGGPLRAVGLPDLDDVAVLGDPRTLAYAAALAVAAGLLTAVVPAWTAGGLDVAAALKSGGRGTTPRRSRLQAGLVVLQAALSVLLVVGAALFVRSLRHAEAHRLGYDVDALAVAGVNLRGTRLDPAAEAALADRLLAAAQQAPGVVAASTAVSVPFWSNRAHGLVVDGHGDVRDLGRYTLQTGSADYFRTTGTRILRGRPFAAIDRAGAALVIVVSDGMARALWPGRDPLGQCVRVGDAAAPCRQVIGVAEDAAMDAFDVSRRYTYYLPVDQFPDGRELQVLARARGPVEPLVGELRARLQAILPGDAYVTVQPLSQLVAPEFQGWRFGATMFAVFGGLALVVALLGLHSLIAYESARRAQEFGVRLALGASRPRLLATVVGRGAGLALGGIAIGLALALAAAGRFDGLLFEQSARDPVVLGGVAVLLAGLAVAASAAPAIRAARLDPTITLRAE
ncbi:MAG: ADOP family duplicated permease [Vicinamibacterales bacterium]